MNQDTELKQLIEDAAKLLGIDTSEQYAYSSILTNDDKIFDPTNQDSGDLMKVAEAAELDVEFSTGWVLTKTTMASSRFTKSDYQSLALAVLRAASAVWKARGE